MDVVGDVVARERRSDDVALRADSRAGSYSYDALCTTCWKAGNLLSHYGVRPGSRVDIDTGESLAPPAITAFFGTTLLGAEVAIDPPTDSDDGAPTALVIPATQVPEHVHAPGTQVLAYGALPDDPTVAHFEREVWSENPTPPPERVDPDAVLLATDSGQSPGVDGGLTHGTLLDVAERVVHETGIEPDDCVVVRAPLRDPGTVVAGLLAPLVAGASIAVGDATSTTLVDEGDVGVGESVPEPRRVDPASVFEATG